MVSRRGRHRAAVAVLVASALILGPFAFIGGAAGGSSSAYVLTTDTAELVEFANVDLPTVEPLGDTVDLAVVRGGQGVHLLSANGTIRSAGTNWTPAAVDVSTWAPNEAAVALVMTRSEAGAWLVTSVGRVIALGDAVAIADVSTIALAAPIIDAGTAGSSGLFLLGGDGGIFSLGSARFQGSVPQVLPGVTLARPLVAIVVTASGRGYWLVAADGGLFAFGDAPFSGSIPQVLPGVTLNESVVGAVSYGDGYLMVAGDGGVLNFSNLEFVGSRGANPPADPVVAISPVNDLPERTGTTSSSTSS